MKAPTNSTLLRTWLLILLLTATLVVAAVSALISDADVLAARLFDSPVQPTATVKPIRTPSATATPGLGAFLSPLSTPTPLARARLAQSAKVHLPLVISSFQWHGVGVAPYTGQSLAQWSPYSTYANYWYHTWSPACSDPADPTIGDQLQRHIPMVRSPNRDGSLATFLSPAYQGSACNDGRPVLVLNEPEEITQDNLVSNPQGVLDVIVQVANMKVSGSWKGPVYVGGIILRPGGAVGGALLDDALALWAQSHGGSRVIPGVTGFHVHPYLIFMAGFNWSISDAARLNLVDTDVQLLRNFIAKRKAEGYSGDTIVTEFGVLAQTALIGRKDQHVKDIFDRYVQGFSAIPELKAWAWFSDDCPYGTGQDAFDLSDLLYDPTHLTPVGERFREMLMQYP
jgi:hypothetical protein